MWEILITMSIKTPSPDFCCLVDLRLLVCRFDQRTFPLCCLWRGWGCTGWSSRCWSSRWRTTWSRPDRRRRSRSWGCLGLLCKGLLDRLVAGSRLQTWAHLRHSGVALLKTCCHHHCHHYCRHHHHCQHYCYHHHHCHYNHHQPVCLTEKMGRRGSSRGKRRGSARF